MFEYIDFPREFQRNLWKELDRRFWTISLTTAVFCSVFIIYMMNQIYVPSLANKQKFLETLYRMQKEVVSDEVVQQIVDQEEMKKKEEEQERVEAKEEKVDDARRKRNKMTDDERKAKRNTEQQKRSQQTAMRRLKAAGMFEAAGVQIGGSGSGKVGLGLGASGSGGDKFAGISGSGGGIVTIGDRTLGNKAKVVSGRADESSSGDIDISELEAGDLEAGDLTGGLEMEDISEVSGEGAQNLLRSAENLDTFVKSKVSSIYDIYERFKRKDPSLNGRIFFRLTILPSGRVEQVNIVNRRWSNPGVGTQVEEKVLLKIKNTWRFGSIEEGDVSVSFNITFY